MAQSTAGIPDSAIVAGVGPERELGAALARRFAENGLHVFIAAGRSRTYLGQRNRRPALLMSFFADV
jgi:NAD(P)-dependent dehydrogenase (short-subunit alcohol dehydrogenase family)